MKSVRFGVLAMLFAMLIAACGGTSTTTTEAGTPTTAAAEGGSILVSGSSTVEPISALVAEGFMASNPEVGITVEGPGTSDGFVRFCAGETDISDASRPIREEEQAACEASGVEFVELHIATDGLSVITSPENADVTCLNFGDSTPCSVPSRKASNPGRMQAPWLPRLVEMAGFPMRRWL